MPILFSYIEMDNSLLSGNINEGYLNHAWADKACNGTVVNWTFDT